MDQKKIEELLRQVGATEDQVQALQDDLEVPVRLIGIGQTGVGKTELLRSIFRMDNIVAEESSEAIMERLKTGAVRSVTKHFDRFVLRNSEGFRVQFTDGPGLGESAELEDKYFAMWIEEIPKHDLLYWVLDASSRDIARIQENMRRVLDATGFRDRLVVVLNKIDQILIPQELELKGVVGWNFDYNLPSKALLKVIEERTADIIEKLSSYADVPRERMVICSARRRYNHDKVLDKLLEYLPEDLRIKASRNRAVKDASELMSEEARKNVADGM